MNTTSLFDDDQPLTVITKERIHSFLPGLWEEVFKIPTPLPSPAPTSEVTKKYNQYFRRFCISILVGCIVSSR